MLSHLVIRNFAIIEHLEIPFYNGFTVLTGETGAGKSIVIDALNLLLGGRAMTEVIRTSETQAVVEGIFEPSATMLARINAKLEDRGITTQEDQIMVRRIVSRSGRNKVFINGSLTTVAALAEITTGLVDISGQHEHYSLLDPEGHIDILDAFAGVEAERVEMAVAYGEVARIRREIAAIHRDVRQRLNRMDFLRFQLEEIDQANLKVEEEEELEEELGRLKYAEKIQDAGHGALSLACDSDECAAQQLSAAAGMMVRAGQHDPMMASLGERFEEACILVEEISRELRSHMMGVESDPRRLDRLISRSEDIKKLKRKHGATIAEILDHAAAMRAELHKLEHAEEHGQHLVEELKRAEHTAFDVAMGLSTKRRSAAERMRMALEAELEDLNMARTSFIVNFDMDAAPSVSSLDSEERDWALTEKGFDEVEFLISPNFGEDPKPLSKIASGGELSRIMLVMKSALAERDHVETYVFDEVDTGIGGSTADMVGWKIARTGKDHQVLCITHLPQIASLSDHHYLVEKQLIDGRTQSTIVPLDHTQRVEEVARMLGGTRVTTTTLEAAREMIHRPLVEGVR